MDEGKSASTDNVAGIFDATSSKVGSETDTSPDCRVQPWGSGEMQAF
jgi:hypothetical protein